MQRKMQRKGKIHPRTITMIIWCIIWTTVLVTLLLGWFNNVYGAELRLSVPIVTMHTDYYNGNISNNVQGVFVEYYDKYNVGIGKLTKNSEGYESDIVYVGGTHKDNNFEYGLAIVYANGYTKFLAKNGYLIFPTLSIKYKYLRLTTSYPSGQLESNSLHKLDFLQAQLVIPIK